jgi:hypothetical protein
MPPCGPHLTPLATGSLEQSLLVFSTPGGLTGDDLSRLFFTCTNTNLQYLAKNQSTQRCQSLITQGSDHPPVLEPHMVLTFRAPVLSQRIPIHAGSLGRVRGQVEFFRKIRLVPLATAATRTPYVIYLENISKISKADKKQRLRRNT